MKIRDKILIYFSTTIISITALSLLLIYILFSAYREEGFQQQQNEKIQKTIRLIEKIKKESETISKLIDQQDINDFYDEKILIYDSNKKLIYTSLDSLDIEKAAITLSKLSSSNKWIETTEANYDLIGIYIEYHNKSYYAVSKAYDQFGYDKLYFLKHVLIGLFLLISAVVIIISRYLSNTISKPITAFADKVHKLDLENNKMAQIILETSSYELILLNKRFNEMIKRTNEAFNYQKNTINHISHQLKTPISILISELEKLKYNDDIHEIKFTIENQIIKAKSLGSIINVLLEISRIESGQQIKKQLIRIDELIFDIINELENSYNNFNFEIEYYPHNFDHDRLIIYANLTLIIQSIYNLLSNSISYSDNSKAKIKFDCSEKNRLCIQISNTGASISKEEQDYLFNHFFRGSNSTGKIGFGLGLVLTKKIIELNSAKISYSNPSPNINVFELIFNLS